MSAHARPSHVEDALRAGAHQVLHRRLDWLLNDDRPYEIAGEHYVIAGVEQRLSLSYQWPTYMRIRPAGPFGTPMHREEPERAEPVHAGTPTAPTRAARS